LIEQQRDEAPWTIRQTFHGLLLTLVPWIVLSIGLNTVNGGNSSTGRHLSFEQDLITAIILLVFSALIEGAFLIAPFYYANKAFRQSTQCLRLAFQALGFRGFQFGQAFFWFVILFPAIVGADIIYQNIIETFHLHLRTNTEVIFENSKSAPLSTYSLLFSAVVIAPFCEEVFFRGFVFTGLRRGMPLPWAIFFSALIFATAHTDIGSFAVLFIIGLALAFLRWRTRSIWPGMLLHMLNNGIAALTVILVMQGVLKQ
jgi:membrane protease YdiL (CAAX protease family)